MFLDYYKLREQPFGVTPNPRYLYLSPTHREAMASILYGVMENRGFSALIAPPGMGKTTLLFDLLQRCGHSMRTIFLFQFQPNPEGLLRNLLAELGIPDEGETFVGMQEKLNQAILQEAKQGKRIVIVVDEAQNFCEPVLEVLRMLSNFETSQEKLIHIILSGQPQLAEILFSPKSEQLRQRISIMAALRPLNVNETREYIEHRLRVAGYQSERPLFTSAASELIAAYSGGIPRNINNYCFNAMSVGFALKQSSLGREIVTEVFQDLNLSVPSISTVTPRRATPSIPQIGSALLPAAQNPRSGRGLRTIAVAISIAAVLCVAGVLANGRLSSPTPLAGKPPAPQIPSEALDRSVSIPATDSVTRPETDAIPDSKPELSSAEPRIAQPALENEPPIAKPQEVRLVKASQSETLYQLCTRNVVGCNAAAIKEIRRLNPWLHNPNELQAGQPVRVPLEMPGPKSGKSKYAKTKSGDYR